MEVRSVLFRAVHRCVYGGVVPLLSRSGRLEPAALRAYRYFTQRPPSMSDLPCPVSSGEMTLWYDPGRPSYTVRALAMGTYERATVELFRTNLRPGMTVLDLGAHIGYFSLLSAACVGEAGRIWSFEPDPGNRSMLERNIAENGFRDRIRVVAKAAGGAIAETNLYRSRLDTGSSSLFDARSSAIEAVPIEVTTLDSWAEAEGWPRIDFVKMDVEGAEVAALAGMTELCRRNPGMAMIVEFNAEALEEAGVGTATFLDALRHRGFQQISVIMDTGLSPIENTDDIRALVRTSRWVPVNLFCRHGTGLISASAN